MQGYRAIGFVGACRGGPTPRWAARRPRSSRICGWLVFRGCNSHGSCAPSLATERVPVILRGPDTPRNRFLGRASRRCRVRGQGSDGDLVRAIGRSIVPVAGEEDGFFTQLQDAESAIRDRIAAYLDDAPFRIGARGRGARSLNLRSVRSTLRSAHPIRRPGHCRTGGWPCR